MHDGLSPAHPPRARLAIALIALGLLAGIPIEQGNPRHALVQVFVECSAPDPLEPWKHGEVKAGSGSGVILSGRRILTNAHVVDHAVQIMVQREGLPRRIPARVEYVDHAADLALLTCDEPGFFDGVPPARLGTLPELQDEVQVLGYPVGGETLSITTGVVSRIERHTYALSQEDLLMAQIDAPVNRGNSGGPVLSDGKLVGIATQIDPDAENTNYMVPAPVIRHFLEDVEDGVVHGYPDLGLYVQPLTNPVLRQSLSLDEVTGGVLVLDIDVPAEGYPLQLDDILLSVDGAPVGADGKVALPGHELRVDYEHLVQAHQIGDTVDLEVLRNGERVDVEHPLPNVRSAFVPAGRPAAEDYFVYGGLVFQRLSDDVLDTLANDDQLALASELIDQSDRLDAERWRNSYVLLSSVLGHEVNQGYEWATMNLVNQVNGLAVSDLEQLMVRLTHAPGPTVSFRLANGRLIVLDIEHVRASEAQILAGYGLPWGRSPRLSGTGS